MQDAIRDAAAAVTMLNGVAVLVKRRNVGSAIVCLVLAALSWLVLFNGTRPNLGTSLSFLLIFGFLLTVTTGIVSTRFRHQLNRTIVHTFFGEKAATRWDESLIRMRHRENLARQRGVSVIDILKEEREP